MEKWISKSCLYSFNHNFKIFSYSLEEHSNSFVVTGIVIEKPQVKTEFDEVLSNVKVEDNHWNEESFEVFVKEEEPLEDSKWTVQNQLKEVIPPSCSKPKSKPKKKFQCHLCETERFFGFSGDLKRHVNAIHLKLKPFQCDLCKISFSERGSLKHHIKVIHKGERTEPKKKFQCPHCENERFFGCSGDLKRHVNAIHLKLKPFQCDLCQVSFSEKGTLKHHIEVIHIGEKNYSCSHCDRKFAGKNTLKKHINSVHLKLKPFECNQCNKFFDTNCNLIQHCKMVHSDERPHQCSQCDKAFISKYILMKHISVVHENIKKFICEICEKGFGSKSNQMRHISSVHNKGKL